ncbi:hypothetical protein DYB28_014904, partial [Aphanomyces astaci]
RVTSKPNGFGTEGVVQVVHDKKKSWTLAISELPVGKWIDDYKTFLWSLVAAKKVQTFTEHHTDRTVHFEVVVPKDDSDDDLAAGIDWTKWFKLESNLNTTNMHAFDSTNTLQKYQSSADILDAFYPVRLALYHRRKEYLVEESTRDLRRLTNRARFVQAMASHDSPLRVLWSSRPSKAQVVALLQAEGFDSSQLFAKNDDHDDADGDGIQGYNYLLKTSFLQFTDENTTKLLAEVEAKRQELSRLEATSAVEMWRGELEALKAALLSADPQYHSK